MALVKAVWAALGRLYTVLGVIMLLVAAAIAAYSAVSWANDKTVPGWVPLALGVSLALLVWLSYLVGRRAYRRLDPESAERAREELEVARNYLRLIVDFNTQLRDAVARSTFAEKIARLEQLRQLVFSAIAQGVNTLPGEYIRCALFEPIEEAGTTVFVTRHYHGHTTRVERLRLDMTSVAGRAFSAQEEIYVPDGRTSPLLQQTVSGRHPVETLLCVPAYGLESGEANVTGVVSVTSNKPDAFSVTDRRFILACAEILGLIGFFLGLYETIARIEAAREAREGGLAPGAREIQPGPGGDGGEHDV